MYDDSDMVMISALQHYLFCPRQCALIHVEGMWGENYLTTTGKVLHSRVDSGSAEFRGTIKRLTALKICSRVYGMAGVADLVEFRLEDDEWIPYPVEYKRGKPKQHRADEVQLCAQALCLEEMFGKKILKGALFYGATKRRCEVLFDDELRRLTIGVVESVRHIIQSGMTPRAEVSKACTSCSLVEFCRPEETCGKVSARCWIDDCINELLV